MKYRSNIIKVSCISLVLVLMSLSVSFSNPLPGESNMEAIPFEKFPEELQNAKQLQSAKHSFQQNSGSADLLWNSVVYGGNGGDEFLHKPLSVSDRIYAIAISSNGDRITRIITYFQSSDAEIWGHDTADLDSGVSSGIFFLHFFGPEEYIKGIKGYHDGKDIQQLWIETNNEKKIIKHGKADGDTNFVIPIRPDEKALGFFGRCDNNGIYQFGAFLCSVE